MLPSSSPLSIEGFWMKYNCGKIAQKLPGRTLYQHGTFGRSSLRSPELSIVPESQLPERHFFPLVIASLFPVLFLQGKK